MKKLLFVLLSAAMLFAGLSAPVVEASSISQANTRLVQPEVRSNQFGERFQVHNHYTLWLFNANGTDTGLRLPQGGEIEVRQDRINQTGLTRVRVVRAAGSGISTSRDFYVSHIAFSLTGALVGNSRWRVSIGNHLWVFNQNGGDTGIRLSTGHTVRVLPRVNNQINNVHRVEVMSLPSPQYNSRVRVGQEIFVDAIVFRSSVLIRLN